MIKVNLRDGFPVVSMCTDSDLFSVMPLIEITITDTVVIRGFSWIVSRFIAYNNSTKYPIYSQLVRSYFMTTRALTRIRVKDLGVSIETSP